LKSPLRYPGGKSRAINTILPLIPEDFMDYREPFIGGGSVFLAVKSREFLPMFSHEITFTISDINHDLICFWQCVRDCVDQLLEILLEYHREYQNRGRELYRLLKSEDFSVSNPLQRAVRFFIFNRITFSGVMDAGGYSQQAFESRFTLSSIERVKAVAPLLGETVIETSDYEPFLFKEGRNVFLFLDPPYYSNAKSKLYGERGILHSAFDHQRFAEQMRRCPHRWLITYDDCPEIRDLYSFAHIRTWQLQYGMNNYKQGKAEKGNEVFIMNY
jgi:DNA adenine methylase